MNTIARNYAKLYFKQYLADKKTYGKNKAISNWQETKIMLLDRGIFNQGFIDQIAGEMNKIRGEHNGG